MNPDIDEDDIDDDTTEELVYPYRDSAPPPGDCDRAPPGWFCSRDKGHAGPCAAWPR